MNKGVITGLPLFKRGKVRDIYVLGDRLLMVATDRISCFDVVLPTEIPGKGKILTALSAFSFSITSASVVRPNKKASTPMPDGINSLL